jgi:cell division protein FtsB
MLFRVPGFEWLSRAALPAACIAVAGYFGSHALFGTNGVLALEGIRQQRTELVRAHAGLVSRKADVERRIALLDPRAVDPDYADELVRRQLGVVRPDEIIYQFGSETSAK